MTKPEKYSQGWFYERALLSIRKIGEGVWDYSDSLLLYVPSGAEAYASIQSEETDYFNLVTKPERDYIKRIAKEVATQLPDGFEYIDLGPGTEHKEQFFFDALREAGKNFVYTPVDISDFYLEHATQHASKQGVSVDPIQSSFEELPDLLGEAKSPRFVSLGLTFTNYEPQAILSLLKNIAGGKGLIFINAQMRDRTDMGKLVSIYREDAKNMIDEKIKLLGLDPDKDITNRETDEGVQVWCEVTRPNLRLERLGVKAGDKFLIFNSLRYTKDQLGRELARFGEKHEVLDNGSPFVGSLIKT